MLNSNYLEPSLNEHNHVFKKARPQKIEAFIFLHDSCAVSKDFYDIIRAQVEERLSFLIPGQKYTVKKICGKVFWRSLGGVEPNLAGKCVAHMVAQGDLPLISVGRSSENHQLYQLI